MYIVSGSKDEHAGISEGRFVDFKNRRIKKNNADSWTVDQLKPITSCSKGSIFKWDKTIERTSLKYFKAEIKKDQIYKITNIVFQKRIGWWIKSKKEIISIS